MKKFIALPTFLIAFFMSTACAGNTSATSDHGAKSTIAAPPLPPSRPRIINFNECRPDYPKIALLFEIQGTTGIAYSFNEDGVIVEAKVTRSSGATGIYKILDQAVLDAVMKCRVGLDSRAASASNNKISPGKGGFDYVFRIEGKKSMEPSKEFSVAPKEIPPEVFKGKLTWIGKNFYYLHENSRKSEGAIYYWTLSAMIERKEPGSQSILIFNSYDCQNNVTEQVERVHYRLPYASGEVMYVDVPNKAFFKPSKVSPNYPIHGALRELCES
jgi:hypothetical protein